MTRTRALLFLAVFLSAASLDHPATWNDNSRLDLVFAVVERGTFRIDAYHDSPPTHTGDKAFFEGHYYSDKVIGVSALAVPVYAAMRLVWRAFAAEPSFRQAKYLLRVTAVSAPAAVAGVLIWQLIVALGGEARRSLVATVLVVFGSLFFGYATVFYPYLPGIAAGLAALWMILFPTRGALTHKGSFAIGALCGFALLCDLLFGLAVLGLAAIYVLRLGTECGALPTNWWPEVQRAYGGTSAAARAGLAVLGGALVLSLFAGYSIAIFGRPAIPYEHHAVDAFREGMQRGLMGITAPKLSALWFITVHPLRGLFFWSPLLLVALAGCALQLLRAGRERIVGVFGLYALAAYLIVNSGYYMWWGGWAMGPRLMLPMFIALPLGLAIFCRDDSRSSGWWVVLALGAISVALSFPVSALDPQTPQMYPDEVYASLRIGQKVEVPQLSQLFSFYSLHWLFHSDGALALRRLTSFVAAIALPAALTFMAIRTLGAAKHGAADRGRRSQT